jgi:hypothetical protein
MTDTLESRVREKSTTKREVISLLEMGGYTEYLGIIKKDDIGIAYLKDCTVILIKGNDPRIREDHINLIEYLDKYNIKVRNPYQKNCERVEENERQEFIEWYLPLTDNDYIKAFKLYKSSLQAARHMPVSASLIRTKWREMGLSKRKK